MSSHSSILGMSSLMTPRISALEVVHKRRFDPLLARKVWWDKKLGDADVQDAHTQRLQNQMVGYGIRKRKPPTMDPPAANLEKRYKLSGAGLNVVGQVGAGLRMAGMRGRGLPIKLAHPSTIKY